MWIVDPDPVFRIIAIRILIQLSEKSQYGSGSSSHKNLNPDPAYRKITIQSPNQKTGGKTIEKTHLKPRNVQITFLQIFD